MGRSSVVVVMMSQSFTAKVNIKAQLLTVALKDGMGLFLTKHNCKMVIEWLNSDSGDQNQPCMVVLGGYLEHFSWPSNQNGFQRQPYTKTIQDLPN